MVTSSAVVGSSAMSNAGLVESAIAIITRWRMPPDSWWGYSLARRLASGMPTNESISTARAIAALRSRCRCRATTSAICSPTVKTGLSEVIGSWKIIAIALPRTSRRSFSGELDEVAAVEQDLAGDDPAGPARSAAGWTSR